MLTLVSLIWFPGLARCPKWGHLKELHRSIKLCEHALVNSEPKVLSLGPLQEVKYLDINNNPFLIFFACFGLGICRQGLLKG